MKKLREFSILGLIAICLCTLVGCEGEEDPETASKAESDSIQEVILEHPEFNLSILPVGIVEYDNEENVKVVGYQTSIIAYGKSNVEIIDAHTEIYIEDSPGIHEHLLEVVNWDLKKLAEGEYPFELSEKISSEIGEGKYINYILYVTFKENGVKIVDIPADYYSEIIKSIPIIPKSVVVDDIIELEDRESKYIIFESAWQWIEDDPDYIEAHIPGGKYQVTHEYYYEDIKYINLEGIGWIIIEDLEKGFYLDVSFFNNSTDTYSEKTKKFKTSIKLGENQTVTNMSIRMDVYISDEPDKYEREEIIASCTEVRLNEIPNTSDAVFDLNCSCGNPKGQYLNKKLYLTYEKDGEIFKDILVDQNSAYYE